MAKSHQCLARRPPAGRIRLTNSSISHKVHLTYTYSEQGTAYHEVRPCPATKLNTDFEGSAQPLGSSSVCKLTYEVYVYGTLRVLLETLDWPCHDPNGKANEGNQWVIAYYTLHSVLKVAFPTREESD